MWNRRPRIHPPKTGSRFAHPQGYVPTCQPGHDGVRQAFVAEERPSVRATVPPGFAPHCNGADRRRLPHRQEYWYRARCVPSRLLVKFIARPSAFAGCRNCAQPRKQGALCRCPFASFFLLGRHDCGDGLAARRDRDARPTGNFTQQGRKVPIGFGSADRFHVQSRCSDLHYYIISRKTRAAQTSPREIAPERAPQLIGTIDNFQKHDSLARSCSCHESRNSQCPGSPAILPSTSATDAVSSCAKPCAIAAV